MCGLVSATLLILVLLLPPLFRRFVIINIAAEKKRLVRCYFGLSSHRLINYCFSSPAANAYVLHMRYAEQVTGRGKQLIFMIELRELLAETIFS